MVLERIANPSVDESRLLGSSPSHSAICPSSPIGMRRLSQKENRVGSNPTLGTK